MAQAKYLTEAEIEAFKKEATRDIVTSPREYKNGECPVCRTAADPIPHGETTHWATGEKKAVVVTQIVRCKRCSCAFHQDSEY